MQRRSTLYRLTRIVLAVAVAGLLLGALQVPYASAAPRGDDYPYRAGAINVPDPWGALTRQCTSFAAFRLAQNGNAVRMNWGNAAQWDDTARARGYRVDSTPAVGAIAQWNGGEGGAFSAGHVAYVAEVRADGSVLIEEYNFGSRPYAYGTRVTRAPRYLHVKDVVGAADQDGDGVPDSSDRCPLQSGPASRHGCPATVLSDGMWYLRNSNTTGIGEINFRYAYPGVVPFVGDWNGDGIDTPGAFHPRTGTWYLRNSNSTGVGDMTFQYGNPGDVPLVGDWNGDGIDTIGVYRSGVGWYLRNSNTTGIGDVGFQYGNPGMIPLVGDWNGDGIDTPMVVEPGTGRWHLRNSNTTGIGEVSFQYGTPGMIPLVGDWNGDGIDTPMVVEPGTGRWHLRNSNTTGIGEVSFQYGNPGMVPLVGDWNGDGIDTIGTGL